MAVGICLMLGGLIWGGLFAGVPYQDPTPEMQATWDMHVMVAEGLLATGAAMLVLGGIVALAAGRRTGAGSTRKLGGKAAGAACAGGRVG